MTEATTWQQRVAEERAELTVKMGKLAEGLGSDLALTIDESDLDLLRRQLYAMMEYQSVLTLRLRNAGA